MGQDRRRHTRFPRLLEVTFQVNGRDERGVSTDVSLSGGFINTAALVAVGDALTLTWEPWQGGPHVCFTGAVCRATDAGDITVAPGIGVRWDRAWTPGPVEHLRAILKDLFQVSVRVRPARQGGAIWLASRAERIDHARGDALRVDAQHLDRPGAHALTAFKEDTELVCYLRGDRFVGRVVSCQGSGFQLQPLDGSPAVGEVLVCFHQIPSSDGPLVMRLVTVVSRQAPKTNVLTLEVLRVDWPLDEQQPAGESVVVRPLN